jgi:hypothetical protein
MTDNAIGAIQSQEPFYIGFWEIVAEKKNGLFELRERDARFRDFMPGIGTAALIYLKQREICNSADLPFNPPNARQLIVANDDVLNGIDAQGTRYNAPEHMSGWYLTPIGKVFDKATFRTTHGYHFAARRPDLVFLLALPPGSIFDSRDRKMWFDQEVARQAS